MEALQSEVSHTRLHDLDKKKLARNRVRASPEASHSHINLVMVKAMIPMVAVVTMPVVVGPPVVVAGIPIGSVVPVWVVAVSITRVAVIAVSISRITNPNPD
jgi:hypothetical protein